MLSGSAKERDDTSDDHTTQARRASLMECLFDLPKPQEALGLYPLPAVGIPSLYEDRDASRAPLPLSTHTPWNAFLKRRKAKPHDSRYRCSSHDGRMLYPPDATTPIIAIENETKANIASEKETKLSGAFHEILPGGRYRLAGELGRGAFSHVRLGLDVHQTPPLLVAVKVIDIHALKSSAKAKAMVAREIAVLQSVRHPSIIAFYDLIETPDALCLVMEYVQGGDLYALLEKKTRLSESEAAILFAELTRVIHYLHRHHICHRDVKLENILLVTQSSASIDVTDCAIVPPSPISPSVDMFNSTLSATIRLADFGLARPYAPGERLMTRCGSEEYASPQLLCGERGYDPEKTDIWALGCVLFAMLTGEMAFQTNEGESTRRMYTKICTGAYTWPAGQDVSEAARRLVHRCLEPDEERRANCVELLQHPWLQGVPDSERLPSR